MQTINREEYHNLLNLINSNDKENRTVAFSVLDSIDFVDNLPVILLVLKKLKKTDRHIIFKEYPTLANKLNKLNINDDNPLRINFIYQLVKEHHTKEGLQFILEEGFLSDLKSHLLEWGFDFCNEVELTIKINE